MRFKPASLRQTTIGPHRLQPNTYIRTPLPFNQLINVRNQLVGSTFFVLLPLLTILEFMSASTMCEK